MELELRELETGQLAGPGGWWPGMQQMAEQCFRPPGSDAPIPSLTQRRSPDMPPSPPSQQQQ